MGVDAGGVGKEKNLTWISKRKRVYLFFLDERIEVG
jgi:hypothetical protein